MSSDNRKLRKADPQIFLKSDSLSKTILTLAHITNELRDSLIAIDELHERNSEIRQKLEVKNDIKPSIELCDYSGEDSAIWRSLISKIKELGTFLKRNKETFTQKEFQDLLVKVQQRYSDSNFIERWNKLIEAATSKTSKEFKDSPLVRVRNFSSHYRYAGEELLAGFLKKFKEEREALPTDLNEFIFYTTHNKGAQVRTTRFCFADAAAIGYVESEFQKDPKLKEDIDDFIKGIGPVFVAIVLTYIENN